MMVGLLEAFRKGLARTREAIARVLARPQQLDDLLEALIAADVGVGTAEELVESVRRSLDKSSPRQVLEQEIVKRTALPSRLDIDKNGLNVFMFVGVNGTGKTTTIGKLAARLGRDGNKVLLAAADTFRAAAAEQLEVWARRAGAELVHHGEGSDPAAVVFDSIGAARSRGCNVVLVDTAGRIQTKVNLMEELKKVKRVIAREAPGQPREVLLVLDATTGQNTIQQARAFKDGLGVTGVVITKMDGSSKGGVAIAICSELGIPVKFVGVGEGIDDLVEFDPVLYARALLDTDIAQL
ncbi:MAG: signal recognition particle-docking protein FtsY [Bacillota bacterium]